jgi:hypothetical protein
LHHTFGHNVFLGALCVAAAAWHHRRASTARAILAPLLVGVCFASHLLADMKFSGWDVRPMWPVSQWEVHFNPNLQLAHPINYWLVYGFVGLALLLPMYRAVTPLDLLSARLDRMALNLFRRRTLVCAACGRPCNDRCDGCGSAVCLRHGALNWRFRVRCPACVFAAGRLRPPPRLE